MGDPGVFEAEFVFFSVGEDHQLLRKIDYFPMRNEIPRPIMLHERRIAGAFFTIENYLSRNLQRQTTDHRGDRVCSTLFVSDGGWVDSQECLGELSAYVSKFPHLIWVTSDPARFPPPSWRRIIDEQQIKREEEINDIWRGQCMAVWPNIANINTCATYGMPIEFSSCALTDPFFWCPP